MSIKVLSAISGPEMGVPISGRLEFFALFLQENLHVHKIPRFRGRVFWAFLGGGVECRFYFYGHGDFSDKNSDSRVTAGGSCHEVLKRFAWSQGGP